jgi:hypothetical protein
MAALAFLKQNEIEAQFEEDELFNWMIGLTEGRLSKTKFAEVLYLSGTENFFRMEPGVIDREIRTILAGMQAPSPVEAKAIILDYLASKIRTVLVTFPPCKNVNSIDASTTAHLSRRPTRFSDD